jgi:hypothetical protein
MGTAPATEEDLCVAIRELVTRLGTLPPQATLTAGEEALVARAKALLLPDQTGVEAFDHLATVVGSIRSDDPQGAEEAMLRALAFATDKSLSEAHTKPTLRPSEKLTVAKEIVLDTKKRDHRQE